MADAQNERTNGRNRRARRRRRRGERPAEEEAPQQQFGSEPEPETQRPPVAASESAPLPAKEAPFVRPAEMAPPTVPSEEYCIHHMSSTIECGPMQSRSDMTTIRHLRVDQFGAAILYCDCLHNGPHEWPPSMQPLHTAIELDQFLADSTSEA